MARPGTERRASRFETLVCVIDLRHLPINRGAAAAALPMPPKSLHWPPRRPVQHSVRGSSVRLYSVFAAAFVATLASPLAAQAQGIPEGAAHGAYVGYNTAGPVGWVVGGVVGGTVGGVEGLFGVGPGYGYWQGPPAAYRHGYSTRHSYRHVRHRYAG